MFRFTILPDDGDAWEVTATTRDIAKWERADRTASLHRLENEYRASDLYAIAYHASVRQGLYLGKLQEFQAECDLQMVGDEDPDPTQPAV